ncbi:MAG TPA: pseudouridine synthase [Lachnospiraceae bacterium]|nr:pseudouridine synthase [Lachnospiraceae bacterium]
MEPKRINKYLAECGICSRREADRLVSEGRVRVNGLPAYNGQIVTGEEEIKVNGQLIRTTLDKVVLAFYKPEGVVVTTKDPHVKKTVIDYVDYPSRLTYAGRLDKDSEGLLLLTNDGDFIHAAMKGNHHYEKEYLVTLNREVQDQDIQTLREGVFLPELEVKTRKCAIERIGKYSVNMVLTQGLNRQIRRMWQTVGYTVTKLKRVRVINIELKSLKPGEYRIIEGEELQMMYQQVGM